MKCNMEPTDSVKLEVEEVHVKEEPMENQIWPENEELDSFAENITCKSSSPSTVHSDSVFPNLPGSFDTSDVKPLAVSTKAIILPLPQKTTTTSSVPRAILPRPVPSPNPIPVSKAFTSPPPNPDANYFPPPSSSYSLIPISAATRIPPSKFPSSTDVSSRFKTSSPNELISASSAKPRVPIQSTSTIPVSSQTFLPASSVLLLCNQLGLPQSTTQAQQLGTFSLAKPNKIIENGSYQSNSAKQLQTIPNVKSEPIPVSPQISRSEAIQNSINYQNLRNKLAITEKKLAASRKKVKTLQQNVRRLQRKKNALRACVMDLRLKLEKNRAGLDILENTSGALKVILKRHLAKKFGSSRVVECPKDLRNFATTLYSYSPRAYKYVRNYFGSCLPHVTTVRKWNKETKKEQSNEIENIIAKVSSEGKQSPCELLVDDPELVLRQTESESTAE